ncbi:unnamed protein product [Clonostachys solani]|uniref:F-box domain-containing protein n=1 Tax=Clonostachys solani TaxID=160281 RepID=A0A9N9ZLK8_9HYPO|nr:unnamed protein product [Clonostachys solani]
MAVLTREAALSPALSFASFESDPCSCQPFPSSSEPRAALTSLPREILHDIFARLQKPDLLSLRLQCAYLSDVATALAFRSLRLVAYGRSPLDFIHIARSERLRGLVQELTCDTAIHPTIVDFRAYGYQEPTEMLKALEFVRFFQNLKALHLRFTRDYWFVYDGEFESMEFRLRFLHTVFSCIVGEPCPIDWDANYEDEMEYHYHTSEDDEQESRSVGEADSQLGDDEGGMHTDDTEHETNEDVVEPEVEELEDEDEEEVNDNDFFDLLQIPSKLLENLPDVLTGPINLTTFTISNLAAQRDARLLENKVFSQVLSSRSLVNLKLLITPSMAGIGGFAGRRADMKISMYGHLPATWIMPSAAANLKELSLYSHEYWGWFPKLDLRDLGELPNLRILALGQYTFSHQWQVDWLASLQLEELYLDHCAVLHQVETWEEWVDGSSAYTVQDDGNNAHVIVPNEGYLNPDWRFMTRGEGSELVLSYPLRWHTMFRQWERSMTSLKVLKVGLGAWRGPPQETVEANYPRAEAMEKRQRFSHNAFRYYRCPPPGGRGEQYREGTGISEDHELALQYLYFEGTGFQTWDHWEAHERFVRSHSGNSFTDWVLENGLRDKDRLAQKLLVSAIQSRGK